MRSEQGRLHEIDGIRGWAALSVLLYHMFIEMFLMVWPEVNGFWPRFFFHGSLAVTVFFVLSGDALSSACLMGGSRTLDAMVVKRYVRLTLPIAASCSVVWVLMQMGLTFNIDAAQLLRHEDWIGACLQFKATLFSLGYYVLYGVYAAHQNKTSYNPFLWTMSVELIGSMLVFLFMYLKGRLRQPKALLLVLMAFTFAVKSFFFCFFVGVLFALLRQEGFWDRLRVTRNIGGLAAVVAVALLAMDVWSMQLPALSAHISMLLGAFLVACFYSAPGFLSFFSNRLSRFLGDISFSLYLVHFAVMVSFTSWLVLRFVHAGAADHSILLAIAAVSTVASLFAAYLLWRLERQMLARLARLPGLLLKSGY